MSASKAFRSHLMQQFAAVARTQSRPPLALSCSSSTRHHQTSSSLLNVSDLLEPSTFQFQQASKNASSAKRHDAVEQEQTGNDQEQSRIDQGLAEVSEAASTFQSTLLSRRTISNLTPIPPAMLKSSLDRAILCAQNAPNHKQTEPTFFKRIISPSPAIDTLAQIAYNVTYNRKLQRDPENAKHLATRKRDKWSQIPAYLVVAIKNQPPQCVEDEDPYQELDFVPPKTELQLEDYASSCAATQNILLSLHSEGIGTKWATGPVIKTRSFRSLIGLTDTDRVVGLIMVGGIGFNPAPRRRRQEWTDSVEDL